MKNLMITTAVTGALIFGATASSAFEIGGIRFGNPFDRSTWWDGGVHSADETVVINFADPDFWMSIPDPAKHSRLHGAFTNPATWAQMFEPQTYMNMMDVDVWKKWTELDTYDVLRDPQTYAYFMQPGAFQHLVNLDHYRQIIEPAGHIAMMNAALGNFGLEVSDITEALRLPELRLSELFGTTADATTAPTADALASPVIEN